MFIKCLTILSYIVSLLFLVYFSFEYSLVSWNKGNNLNFVLMMMLIVLLISLIVTACLNLSTTLKEWRERINDQKRSEFDQIVE